MQVSLDGVDILLLFLLRIGVVEAQVGLAAKLVRKAEINADGLGVADVQIAVGLRRKARLNDRVAVLLRAHVLGHLVAKERGRVARFRSLCVRVHDAIPCATG